MAGLTATETFCAMLDERGVEYHTHGTTDRTWFEVGGISWFVIERENGSLTADAVFLTPEQAIAATLGLGTCRVIATKKLGDLFGYRLSCGHSMVNPFDDHPDYCPWCGAKVVEPTTNDVDAEVGE